MVFIMVLSKPNSDFLIILIKEIYKYTTIKKQYHPFSEMPLLISLMLN